MAVIHNFEFLMIDLYTLHSKSLMSRNTAKDTSWLVSPSKTQISLRIRAVWSESSMTTLWVAKGPTFLKTENLVSDQTVGLRRLIRFFTVRRCHLVLYAGYGS